MPKTIREITEKESRLAIGLMSGTSADGVDAVLVRIHGFGPDIRVNELGFLTVQYEPDIRNLLLSVAGGEGGSRDICSLNFLLGGLFTTACVKLCDKYCVGTDEIDFIASHGHTIWHQPADDAINAHIVRSTLQIGEASLIAEKFGCPVICDFRVRDVAAGGLGAPLVPYSEYYLYRRKDKNIALQNIGGIGNITILPANGEPDDTYGFDTGPGNMLIDAVVDILTKGEKKFDNNGEIASSGTVNKELFEHIIQTDGYVTVRPPKTTGREHYGKKLVEEICAFSKAHEIEDKDQVATVTYYTAWSVGYAAYKLCRHKPDILVAGGGGCRNKALMAYLKEVLKETEVVTNEELGFNSDSKEAVAFAVLGNETLFLNYNNVPSVTGASHPVVMGKIIPGG